MDYDLLILNSAVFAASALQSATGIGFGVIAGPILLLALNDGTAIQISIVLNLLIATVLAPSLRQHANKELLKRFMIGLLIGSPVGFLIFLNLEIAWLKTFAGFAVLFTLFVTVRGYRNTQQTRISTPRHAEQVSLGAVAGLMGASLAMPGPIPAAWMSVKGYDRNTVRATILLMFVLAYAVALALQFVGSGIGANTWRLCMVLTPATIFGIIAGRILNHRVSEQIFRWALIAILATTATMLFSTLV